MEAKFYVLRVSHDEGTAYFKTCAGSEDSAKRMIANAEGCPVEAVKAKEIPQKLFSRNAAYLFKTINA